MDIGIRTIRCFKENLTDKAMYYVKYASKISLEYKELLHVLQLV